MRFVLATIATTALHPASDPPKPMPPQVYSCAQIRRAVRAYGEEVIVTEARNRGVAEHVIEFLRKTCMEKK